VVLLKTDDDDDDADDDDDNNQVAGVMSGRTNFDSIKISAISPAECFSFQIDAHTTIGPKKVRVASHLCITIYIMEKI
jgi:hypothetical protein